MLTGMRERGVSEEATENQERIMKRDEEKRERQIKEKVMEMTCSMEEWGESNTQDIKKIVKLNYDLSLF